MFLVFPSLLEAIAAAVVGRNIAYTATIGLAIAIAVLVKQVMLPAAPEARATNRS